MVNKTQEIQLELVLNNLDLCILTETWIKEGDTTSPSRLCPSGYKALSISRHGKIGGGIAIVYKNNLNISITRGQPFKTMESTCFSINTGSKVINLMAIYRPPDSNVLEFCNELANLLESKINSSGELILLGDFNITVNKPLDDEPATFLDVLNSFNLIYRVDKSTHRLSNTLDLIIHDADSNIIPRIKIDRFFSDHNIVLFDISTPCTVTNSEITLYRKFKNINPVTFMEDVKKFCLKKPPGSSLEDKISHYYTMPQSTLDHQAPIKSWKCSNWPKFPWFTDRFAEAFRLRRSLERTWHRDRSNAEAYTLFHQQHWLVSNLLNKAERDFYCTSITENSSNYKQIYEICNHLLGRTKDSPMPPGVTNKDLAYRFNNFFIDKITKICNDLIVKEQHLPTYVEIPAPPNTKNFCKFQPNILSNLQKIIWSTPNKNCHLDPIPTSLLKQILPSIVSTIADIINTSLRDGTFPESFKRALVRPLLKKLNLDLLERNYRPVSNLSYVSKLVECVTAAQLVNHIERHNLKEVHQSAYCAFHSMETALLKVKTDVIKVLKNQEVACLILLDLFAAFNTTDQNILLGRLETRFAVTGTTLNWLRSYLTNRTQAVAVGDPLLEGSRLAFVLLKSGIPQGSVLGPILFTMCTAPIGDIYKNNYIEFHLYADDTQIYLSFKPSISNSKFDCIARIEKCINEINIWMTQNLLKWNSDKTEFILFGTRHQLSKVDNISIQIGNGTVKPANHVRNLGYVMDSLLKNGPHVNKITSSCYCTLHNIARIRPSLDTKSAQHITQALVTLQLDYCNTLLAGSSKYQIDKLQCIQNMSCRIVCNINKYDHISPAMRDLHWLKIPKRIIYKLCLLVYKCCNNLAPKYLSELLPSRTSSRPIRSSHSANITEAYFKNSQCQCSSFSLAGPRAWNSLPTRVKTAQSLNSFKSLLNTYLFTISYNEWLPFF